VSRSSRSRIWRNFFLRRRMRRRESL
jgi:hypothetical protein